jgi:hypothetical protein
VQKARPGKAPPSLAAPARKSHSTSNYSARVVQYTILQMLPEIQQRISELQRENYSVPEMQHGHRRLVLKDRVVAAGESIKFDDSDYTDARDELHYAVPDLPLRETITTNEIQKLQRIAAALGDLLRGCTVKPAVLLRLLDAQQSADYSNALDAPVHSSEITYGDGEPEELRSYKQRVAAADFEFAKAEKMAARRRNVTAKYNPDTVKRAYNRAEHLYEVALECLEEMWSSASPHERWELQSWMDRDIDFDAGNDRRIGIECDTIPRVRGSRSANALDSGLPKLNRRLKQQECQLTALRSAAWQIAFAVDEREHELNNLPQHGLLAELLQKAKQKETQTAKPATGKSKLQQILDGLDDDEY